jgi:hypothetical protein
VPASADLQFVPLRKGVDAAEDQVTQAQGFRSFLPAVRVQFKVEIVPEQTLKQPRRYVGLGGCVLDILNCRANKPVEVAAVIYALWIVEYKLAEADVSELLNYVRTAPAEPDHSDLRTANDALGALAEEALSAVALTRLVHALLHMLIG